jgi:hypothetical protein
MARNEPPPKTSARQILFVQGAGDAVHDTWDDKLVQSLKRELGEGYSVLYRECRRKPIPATRFGGPPC